MTGKGLSTLLLLLLMYRCYCHTRHAKGGVVHGQGEGVDAMRDDGVEWATDSN